METLKYQIEISAPAKKVWDTMLEKETYEQWVSKSWPDSTYEGRWGQGEHIKFVGPNGAGTLAELVQFKPYEEVLARHVALLGPNGEEDRTSDVALGWIGITEGYRFIERDGKTTLTVTIETKPEWRSMFDEGWPGALEVLKRITENQLATA
jgi:uncharacterized protein YndB with AHSA1/START domain